MYCGKKIKISVNNEVIPLTSFPSYKLIKPVSPEKFKGKNIVSRYVAPVGSRNEYDPSLRPQAIFKTIYES